MTSEITWHSPDDGDLPPTGERVLGYFRGAEVPSKRFEICWVQGDNDWHAGVFNINIMPPSYWFNLDDLPVPVPPWYEQFK